MEFSLDTFFAGVMGAAITGLLGYFGVVKKVKADETAIALEAWKSLLEPLQIELQAAKEEITKLREELEARDATHKKEITALMNRVRKVDQNTKHIQE